MAARVKRYEQVAGRILNLIHKGVLKEGEKIPSIRGLSREMRVSINTVKEAYWRLENQNYIVAVPQSGFYVKKQPRPLTEQATIGPCDLNPQQVSLCRIYGAYQNLGRCTPEVSLGIAALNPQFWPVDKIGAVFQKILRDRKNEAYNYMMAPGFIGLREQIARIGLASGLDLSPEEIVITSGCHEAVFLALQAVCKPGDTVVFESPIYFNLLQLLKQLNLRIIELPSSFDEGIHLDTLKFVLDNHPVKAMFTISNFNNPLGFSMPEGKKKRLVRLLAEYGIPLIEDDIYGDTGFRERPDTCKAYDEHDNVLLCSSFSKTIAPGLRVGWIAPGRFYDQIVEMKTLLNIATGSINQLAVAQFLKEGGYERHLRQLRGKLRKQMTAMRAAILNDFPAGTRVTRPEGGFLLWVELPEGIDTSDIYREVLKKDILIAPGRLFSVKEKYINCMRLNAGIWNGQVEAAVGRLGEVCGKNLKATGDSCRVA